MPHDKAPQQDDDRVEMVESDDGDDEQQCGDDGISPSSTKHDVFNNTGNFGLPCTTSQSQSQLFSNKQHS